EERQEIDKWVISLLNSLVKNVVAAYEDYDITSAGRLLQDFVCDHLSNWYVRLNRKRFWGGSLDKDKLAAYQTLYEALVDVALLSAPIAPFFSEKLYLDLVPSAESVHFEAMPVCDPARIDKDLEERMDLAQRASSMVLALRRKINTKVRQPLSKLIIPVLDGRVKEQLEKVRKLLLTEVNVKELEFITDTAGLITKKIRPNFKTLGKKYGAQMKAIAAYFATMTQEEIARIEAEAAIAEEVALHIGDAVVSLLRDDYEITSEDMPGWLVATDGPLTLALDVTITEELKKEGIARELVNRIQNLRKDTGFDVTDRIEVAIYADGQNVEELQSALGSFGEYVAQQTLAKKVEVLPLPAPENAAEIEWGEGDIWIYVNKL
ncbi:MAG: DUF5915 domain-containing protein, partial [Bacteroidales bacterium]|nr:DUF5915 domain-containing protein [Bacteroidales bacterium]